jgi:hypothetical protein
MLSYHMINDIEIMHMYDNSPYYLKIKKNGPIALCPLEIQEHLATKSIFNPSILESVTICFLLPYHKAVIKYVLNLTLAFYFAFRSLKISFYSCKKWYTDVALMRFSQILWSAAFFIGNMKSKYPLPICFVMQ